MRKTLPVVLKLGEQTLIVKNTDSESESENQFHQNQQGPLHKYMYFHYCKHSIFHLMFHNTSC